MSDHNVSRRQALGSVSAIVAGTVAGTAIGRGQSPGHPNGHPTAQSPRGGGPGAAAGLGTPRAAQRPLSPDDQPVRKVAPREELVNVLEYEEAAKKTLAPATFALIAGGDRALFERITLRPRMLVPTIEMDLSVTLFGEEHFTPILVAPISDQKRFHPDAELATARGATAGKALMVVSSRSSVPLDQIAAVARPSFWYQVYASDSAAKTQVQDAVKTGAKAIVITVGASPNGSRFATSSSINWGAVDSIRQGVSVPILVKGITTPAEANAALQRNVQGIIVSNFGGMLANKDAMILMLPNIVDAVSGTVPVLADGAFRRGTDVIKALAFGAQGVLIGRPVMWGLSAYGEAGVQGVVEMLQTELGRYMGMLGKVNLKALDRSLLKVHGPLPAKTATTNN